MRGYDAWHTMREAADALPCGLRAHRSDTPPEAAIWLPKATKPAGFYRFRTIEAREQYIERFVTNYAEVQDMKAKRRAEAAERTRQHADAIQVGHIFCYSWGYDQTNVEYYQVIAKRGQNVVVREIAQSMVPGSQGFMSESVKPRIGHFLEHAKPLTKRPYFDTEGRAYLSFEFGSCSLWRGSAHYQSHYA